MRYTLTAEQQQFREMVHRFLGEKSPATEVRRLMETADGFDPHVWRQLSEELGLTALIIPEQYGGAGFGFTELGIALEEMGRTLLCAPFLSSAVLATSAILNAASEEQKQSLLPELASGRIRAALALTGERGCWQSPGEDLLASRADRHPVLHGVSSFVVDGHSADLIIAVARSDSGPCAFYGVRADAKGLERTPLQSLDATRKLARLRFDGVPAERLGDTADAEAALAQTLDQVVIALASEQVGGAQALFDAALAYSKMRMQFGRVIGSFQAIKHRFADMLIQLELAKSGARYAAAAIDAGDPEVPVLAPLVRSAASEAYMNMAAEVIQIHGGIGFTWDQDTHLWFRRAKSSEVFLGDPAFHRELMMQRMGEEL